MCFSIWFAQLVLCDVMRAIYIHITYTLANIMGHQVRDLQKQHPQLGFVYISMVKFTVTSLDTMTQI